MENETWVYVSLYLLLLKKKQANLGLGQINPLYKKMEDFACLCESG